MASSHEPAGGGPAARSLGPDGPHGDRLHFFRHGTGRFGLRSGLPGRRGKKTSCRGGTREGSHGDLLPVREQGAVDHPGGTGTLAAGWHDVSREAGRGLLRRPNHRRIGQDRPQHPYRYVGHPPEKSLDSAWRFRGRCRRHRRLHPGLERCRQPRPDSRGRRRILHGLAETLQGQEREISRRPRNSSWSGGSLPRSSTARTTTRDCCSL